MKIIIVGCGKVGMTLAEELNHEGHDITIIDQDSAVVDKATQSLDVMGVTCCAASSPKKPETAIRSPGSESPSTRRRSVFCGKN